MGDYPGCVTGANHREYDTDLLDVVSTRVLVGDGAMGTQLHAADLALDDLNQVDGGNEILDESKYVRLQSG